MLSLSVLQLKTAFKQSLQSLRQQFVTLLKLLGLQGALAGVTFGKEALLSALFGLSAFLDAYVLVNNLLIFSRSFFDHLGYSLLIPLYNEVGLSSSARSCSSAASTPSASASIGASGLPATAQSLQEATPQQQQVVSVLFNYALVGSASLALLGAVFSVPIAQLLAPGWQGERLDYLLALIIWLLPLSLVSQCVELLRVLCIQQRRFTLLYWPRIVGYVLFIGLFAWAFKGQGWVALLWVLPFSLLFELGLYLWRVPLKPSWQWRLPSPQPSIPPTLPNESHASSGAKPLSAKGSFLRRLGATSLCWLMFYFTLLIDNYFLAQLPVGEPGAFRYALVSLFILSNLSVGNIALMGLSQLTEGCSQGRLTETRGLLLKRMALVLGLSVPLIAGLYWASPWLIALMFQRGEFTAEDTALVSRCFQWFLLLLPYEALWKVVNACFYALGAYRPFLLLAASILVLRVAMNQWGVVQAEPLVGLIQAALANWYLLLSVLGGYLIWRLSQRQALVTKA